MIHLILKFLGIAGAVWLVVTYIPGLSLVGGWTSLLLVSALWAALSLIIKPVLNVLTLPISIVTLGFSSLVINVLLFWGMTLLIPGFVVAGFVPALLGTLALTICTSFINSIT